MKNGILVGRLSIISASLFIFFSTFAQEPEKPETEPVDGYEEALSELNLVNAHEKPDMMPSLSSDDNPQDKISQMASEAGEMIEEMGEEK